MKHEFIESLIDLAVAIQQVPAPTFREAQRADLVRGRFVAEGLPVEVDEFSTVYALVKGSGQAAPVVISAHLDTVFPESVDLTVQREPERILGPGLGDNSLGVAGLFGLLWRLQADGVSLPGDVWLVANSCEEGLGDLRGIRRVVERFGERPAAYLIVEGMALGQVYHRALGVRRQRISVHTSGGHSWIDYGQPSAIHELTAISGRITALELPRQPRTTLNIGVISGGASVNTIAPDASLDLDLRSEDPATLEKLAGQVQAIVQAAEKPGVHCSLERIGQRPAGEIPADHPLVQKAVRVLRELDIEPRLNIGSTDANIALSLGLPAVTIGLTTGGKAHTVHEFINLPPLPTGLEQLVRLTRSLWD